MLDTSVELFLFYKILKIHTNGIWLQRAEKWFDSGIFLKVRWQRIETLVRQIWGISLQNYSQNQLKPQIKVLYSFIYF